ncbi:hypothetical protein Tco_1392674 [Tanacetum coccineum]
MLCRDRLAHARTTRLMKSEARLSREAWVQLMASSDSAHSEVRALRTTILAQQTEIEDLQAADRKRQTQLTEALTLLRTLQTQMASTPMTWTNLKKKMTDSTDQGADVKKLESERKCAKMFPEEYRNKIEKDVIEFATKLRDKKIGTFAERQSENKRKQDDNQHHIRTRGRNTWQVLYAAGS